MDALVAAKAALAAAEGLGRLTQINARSLQSAMVAASERATAKSLREEGSRGYPSESKAGVGSRSLRPYFVWEECDDGRDCGPISSACGLVGGFFNAIVLSDNLFLWPQGKKVGNNWVSWSPGGLLNVFAGGAAALVSWALYGPVATLSIIDFNSKVDVTLAALASAFVMGIGGAHWLGVEADKRNLTEDKRNLTEDKRNLTEAGALAAGKERNPQLADDFGRLSPAEILKAAVAAPK